LEEKECNAYMIGKTICGKWRKYTRKCCGAMNDKVSIITPLHDSDTFIADIIDSVLAQRYDHWELLIVNYASSDQSVAIVQAYQEKDPRIKLFRNSSNQGPAITRNRAIREATGRFIAFLDSDDLWLPDKLQLQINFMLKHQH